MIVYLKIVENAYLVSSMTTGFRDTQSQFPIVNREQEGKLWRKSNACGSLLLPAYSRIIKPYAHYIEIRKELQAQQIGGIPKDESRSSRNMP
jgi:hypothetical protein